MDNEMKKMLKDLIGDLLKDSKDMLQSRLEEAHKEPVTILMENDKDGKSTIKVEGERLAILIALAGLEKSLLKRLNVPTDVWEMLKQVVGTEEVDE